MQKTDVPEAAAGCKLVFHQADVVGEKANSEGLCRGVTRREQAGGGAAGSEEDSAGRQRQAFYFSPSTHGDQRGAGFNENEFLRVMDGVIIRGYGLRKDNFAQVGLKPTGYFLQKKMMLVGHWSNFFHKPDISIINTILLLLKDRQKESII